MANPCCDPFSDLVSRTVDCVCEDIKKQFPICSAVVNMCYADWDDEDDSTITPPSSNPSPSQPTPPNQPAQPTPPAQANSQIPPLKIEKDERAPESSKAFFLSDADIADIAAKKSPAEAKEIKEYRDIYLRILRAFNRRPETDRRFFHEIHLYPSDPNFTVAFPHFASGGNDHKLFNLMESVPETKEAFCKRIAERLKEDSDYLDQFRIDFNDLLKEEWEPNQQTTEEEIKDKLKRYILFDTEYLKKEEVLTKNKHTLLAKWIDNRVLHYDQLKGSPHREFKIVAFRPDAMKDDKYYFNVKTYNKEGLPDCNGDMVEVSSADYAKNSLGAYRRVPKGNAGTHKRVCNTNFYLPTEKCVQINNQWFAQYKIIHDNGYRKALCLNLLTYSYIDNQWQEDIFGNRVLIEERITKVKDKEGNEKEKSNRFCSNAFVVERGKEKEPLSLTIGDSSVKTETDNQKYVIITRGADLFPGYDTFSGYWFNDLLPEALSLPCVKEWELYRWGKFLESAADLAKNNLVIGDTIGGLAALLSFKSSGGFSSEPCKTTYGNLKFNNPKRVDYTDYKLIEDCEGDFLDVSSSQITKISPSLIKKNCIKYGEKTYVLWRDYYSLRGLYKNIRTFSLEADLNEDIKGAYVRCSEDTYDDKGKKDNNGKNRLVLGTSVYVSDKEWFPITKGYCVKKDIKKLEKIKFNLVPYSIESIKIEQDDNGLYLVCSSEKYNKKKEQDDKGSYRIIVDTDETIPVEKCLQVSQNLYVTLWNNKKSIDKQLRKRIVGKRVALSEPLPDLFFYSCSAQLFKKKSKRIAHSDGDLRLIEHLSDSYANKDSVIEIMCDDGLCYLVPSSKTDLKNASTNVKTFTLKNAVITENSEGAYLSCTSDLFNVSGNKITINNQKGSLRFVVGSVQPCKKAIQVKKNQCIDLGKDDVKSGDREWHLVLWKSDDKLISIEKNLFTYKLADGTINDNEESGAYFLVTEGMKIPEKECLKDSSGRVCARLNLNHDHNKPSESEKQSLRVWLSYMKYKGKIRDRNSQIYEDWFRNSWGEIPAFVEWREEIGYTDEKHVEKEWTFEGTVSDGGEKVQVSKQAEVSPKKSIAELTYSYTGIPMETKKDLFKWETLKKCLHLSSEVEKLT